jgi:hypothetical protein
MSRLKKGIKASSYVSCRQSMLCVAGGLAALVAPATLLQIGFLLYVITSVKLFCSHTIARRILP